MRVLVVSVKGDGLWYSWLLDHNGHTVDTYIADPKYVDTFEGIIKAPLKHLPNPSPYDLVVFDADGMGEDADYARLQTPTIGSSSLADRLEQDRLFGLEVMEQCGIRVPKWEAFDSPDKGISYLEQNKGRYVFKPIGDVDDKATTYVSRDEKDMIQFMERVFKKAKIQSYVLQEFVRGGTEAAVCGWFNGDDWVVVDHNIEEKKLMPGNIGPNTGCAGITVWIPPRPTPMFEQGLAKVAPFLRDQGYVGPIDLNTICTESTAYGIEWTPRFAYEGTPNLTRLLPIEFGEFLHRVATRQEVPMATSGMFSSTIRVATPPYPNADKARRKEVVPILGIDLDDLTTFFLCDARVGKDGALETTGAYNCIGAPIGIGETIQQSFAECEQAIKRLNVPDLMWRNDVSKSITERYNTLRGEGWLKPVG